MKKKVYISPMAEVTKVTFGHHICIGSVNTSNSTDGLDEELDYGGDDPGDFSRRRRSPRNQWDNEEELSGENSEGLFY